MFATTLSPLYGIFVVFIIYYYLIKTTTVSDIKKYICLFEITHFNKNKYLFIIKLQLLFTNNYIGIRFLKNVFLQEFYINTLYYYSDTL